MTANNRPISPHLQVYKPQLTSVLSIMHRITGVVLCAGAFLLTFLLMSATYGPEMYATAQSLLGGFIGRIVLFGVVFSLWYHLANGIRHLAWDAGWGFELEHVRASGIAVVVIASLLTIATFIVAYAVRG